MAYSGANPAEGIVSAGNSSVGNLAANAVFTGTSDDVTIYSNIKINVYSSHISATDGLNFQQSHDGILWIPGSDVYTIPALAQKSFSIATNLKFFRVVYTNGATLTTTLVIQTLYHKSDKQASSIRPQDGRGNDNDYIEMLSHLMGYNSTANAWNRIGITNAVTGGNENLIDRIKVNAALRMIDNAQPSGSKLVNLTGTQALGLDVNVGTDITTPTAMPAGGIGVRGWLSSIWTKLNGTLAVTGAFFQATQPVSGAFFQATQPVSLATNTPTLATGTNSIGNINELRASALAVTGTSAAGTSLTITLPAVAAQFHYITSITMVLYSSAARTGAAAPTVVTTTNIPGAIAFTFSTAGAIGATDLQDLSLVTPIKSSTVNTATTIVAPIAAGGIWRITVTYFTGA